MHFIFQEPNCVSVDYTGVRRPNMTQPNSGPYVPGFPAEADAMSTTYAASEISRRPCSVMSSVSSCQHPPPAPAEYQLTDLSPCYRNTPHGSGYPCSPAYCGCGYHHHMPGYHGTGYHYPDGHQYYGHAAPCGQQAQPYWSGNLHNRPVMRQYYPPSGRNYAQSEYSMAHCGPKYPPSQPSGKKSTGVSQHQV